MLRSKNTDLSGYLEGPGSATVPLRSRGKRVDYTVAIGCKPPASFIPNIGPVVASAPRHHSDQYQLAYDPTGIAMHDQGS